MGRQNVYAGQWPLLEDRSDDPHDRLENALRSATRHLRSTHRGISGAGRRDIPKRADDVAGPVDRDLTGMDYEPWRPEQRLEQDVATSRGSVRSTSRAFRRHVANCERPDALELRVIEPYPATTRAHIKRQAGMRSPLHPLVTHRAGDLVLRATHLARGRVAIERRVTAVTRRSWCRGTRRNVFPQLSGSVLGESLRLTFPEPHATTTCTVIEHQAFAPSVQRHLVHLHPKTHRAREACFKRLSRHVGDVVLSHPSIPRV